MDVPEHGARRAVSSKRWIGFSSATHQMDERLAHLDETVGLLEELVLVHLVGVAEP